MMTHKNVVLVTGGSGLVGSAVKKIVLKNSFGYNWIFLSSSDADLRNYKSTLDIFSRYNPSHVIHLAARVGGLYKNISEGELMFRENDAINYNVMLASHATSVKKVVLCLSTCIFPDTPPNGYPLLEKDLHDGPPHSSNCHYAYAKRLMAIRAKNFNKFSQTQFLCVIPTNIYGPNDNYNLENSHVIPSLIHKCYLAKTNNTTFDIKGSGIAHRQFIYSKDVAKNILHVLFFLKVNDIPNGIILAPTEDYQVRNVVDIIANIFNFPKSKIKYDTSFEDGQHRKTASNFLFNNYFPKSQNISLTKGLEKTILWFVFNYHSIIRK